MLIERTSSKLPVSKFLLNEGKIIYTLQVGDGNMILQTTSDLNYWYSQMWLIAYWIIA